MFPSVVIAALLFSVPADTPASPTIPDGTYTYSWILNGKEVGETTFTVTTRPVKTKDAESPDAPRENERQILGQWTFSARGNAMRSSNQTIVDAASHAARSYVSQQTTRSAGSWGVKDEISAVVDNGIMSVRRAIGQTVTHTDLITPMPGFFLALQAFEHLVFVMALAHETGTCTHDLIDPRGSTAILKTTITKEKVEGDETRWSFVAPGMKGQVWLSKRGLVTRYEQGELAIVHRPNEKSGSQPKEPKKK